MRREGAQIEREGKRAERGSERGKEGRVRKTDRGPTGVSKSSLIFLMPNCSFKSHVHN